MAGLEDCYMPRVKRGSKRREKRKKILSLALSLIHI